jgi:O-antigen ligase
MLWLLIGYMFLFIHRPFEVWPWLGDFHLERIYMLGTLFAAIAWSGKKWLPNRMHWAFGAMAVAVLLCWLASPWGSAGDHIVEDYFKIFVFYGLLVMVVHDEQNLKRLALAFLGVMTVYLAHSFREYLNGRHVYTMSIARMIGVDTTMGDPNSFGATIVYVLPFVMPFWMEHRTRLWRLFLGGYVALSVVCIGLTGSRSSFVGLLLASLIIILKSRFRGRLAVAALVLTPALWAALPESLQTRFETIVDPSVGPANAQTSAEGRIEGLRNGVKLWQANPFTGCGPGAWRPATASKIESHNVYAQVIGELGSVGVVAFVAVLLGFWVNLRWIRRAYQEHPEWGHDFLYRLAESVGLGVVLMLFLGNFGHNLYRYSWLWYGGFLIITRYCIEQRLRTLAFAQAWQAWPAKQAAEPESRPELMEVTA